MGITIVTSSPRFLQNDLEEINSSQRSVFRLKSAKPQVVSSLDLSNFSSYASVYKHGHTLTATCCGTQQHTVERQMVLSRPLTYNK